MTNEIYTTPDSQLDVDTSEATTLASRWSRLFASILDGFVIMAITLPVMYVTGGFEGLSEGIQPSIGYTLSMGILGLAVFVLANGKFLLNDGQTIGKKALGIKIVDLDGALPDVKQHLVKRYAVYFIPGQIPIIGQLFSMINILFVFGKEKRCVHDIVAGTKVVNS